MSASFEAVLGSLRERLVLSADKPEETAETTLQALWMAAAGAPRAVGRLTGEVPALSAAQLGTLEALLARRLAGEPLAYLTGLQEFMGREFLAEPGALIPRRETELLGRAAADLARRLPSAPGAVRILDLCTGAGNLAVSLALEVSTARVWASDLEAAAVELAGRNASRHGVGDRVALASGDLFAALDQFSPPPGPFDLIVCNPPYIPSHKAQSMPVEVGGFEPPAAFDGGDFGLSILLRLVAEAPRHLAPGGWLCFELGAGQGAMIERRLAKQGSYGEIRRVSDAVGTTRALLAQRAAGA